MGRRQKYIKEARRIIVTIGTMSTVFPLDRELLRSRAQDHLTAKRLRPAAVEYLRQLEQDMLESVPNEESMGVLNCLPDVAGTDSSWAHSPLDKILSPGTGNLELENAIHEAFPNQESMGMLNCGSRSEPFDFSWDQNNQEKLSSVEPGMCVSEGKNYLDHSSRLSVPSGTAASWND
jgi:hypothetical protein